MLDTQLIESWSENYVTEPDQIRAARLTSIDHGIEPITPAMGSFLRSLVAMTNSKQIVEVGTGLGVSSQWLLAGNEAAHLTTLEKDVDHQQTAKDLFGEAGITTSRVRLISGEPNEVLARLNEETYDLVVINSRGKGTMESVKTAIHLVRPGGVVVVTHVLAGGNVANPTKRDADSVELRTLLGDYAVDEMVTASLVPVGDGILTLVKK